MGKTVSEVAGALEKLGAAEEILSILDSVQFPPGFKDQVHAAQDETFKILEQAPRRSDEAEFGGDDRAQGQLLMMVMIVGIGQRGIKDYCRHCQGHDWRKIGPRPTFVAMGQKYLGCQRCIVREMMKRTDRDDGLCDYCNEPTTTFWPVRMTVGICTFFGDFCTACGDELKRLIGDA